MFLSVKLLQVQMAGCRCGAKRRQYLPGIPLHDEGRSVYEPKIVTALFSPFHAGYVFTISFVSQRKRWQS